MPAGLPHRARPGDPLRPRPPRARLTHRCRQRAAACSPAARLGAAAASAAASAAVRLGAAAGGAAAAIHRLCARAARPRRGLSAASSATTFSVATAAAAPRSVTSGATGAASGRSRAAITRRAGTRREHEQRERHRAQPRGSCQSRARFHRPRNCRQACSCAQKSSCIGPVRFLHNSGDDPTTAIACVCRTPYPRPQGGVYATVATGTASLKLNRDPLGSQNPQ